MKITILVIGKTNKGFVSQGVDEYLKRLTRYVRVGFEVIPDVKNCKNLSADQLMQKEEALLNTALSGRTDIYLLDEKGKEPTSMEFSNMLQAKMLSGTKEVVLVVGGAYGVSPLIKNRVKDHISMSRLTFSHQMIRLILVEQLYRAMTILKGEPYHHE